MCYVSFYINFSFKKIADNVDKKTLGYATITDSKTNHQLTGGMNDKPF